MEGLRPLMSVDLPAYESNAAWVTLVAKNPKPIRDGLDLSSSTTNRGIIEDLIPKETNPVAKLTDKAAE